MNELRDAQLVTQRLMERHEREWNERFETLTSIVHGHEQRLANAENGIIEMRAALSSVLTSLDNFVKGLRPNGN
ncbi:MAG: hypothetical protein HYX72_12605 [Acidobacteria bacterium]|nr:hypothetical protein [Acidobacteriota bacterium]